MTVTASWWVEYSTPKFAVSPHGAVTSFFSFIDREVMGIAPITEVTHKSIANFKMHTINDHKDHHQIKKSQCL